MKLSMWMLADRLSGHVLRADIGGGSADIAGVRFLSEELSGLSPEYVYIGRASVVVTDPVYENTVLLVHGHDLMFIEPYNNTAQGMPLVDVLNEVLSAFDFYNAWEASLWEAAAFGSAVQRMVDLCGGVMGGPIAVSDSAGNVVAFTSSSDPDIYDDGWRYVYETGKVPQTYTSSRIMDAQGNLLSDWDVSPQIYHMDGVTCIGSQILSDGEYVAAFFMQEFEKKFTPADVQLAETFCRVLSSLSSVRGAGSDIGLKSGAAILSAILDGSAPGQRELQRLDGLTVSPPHQLVLLRSVTASVNIVRKNTLLETIKRSEAKCVSFIYGDDIVCITPKPQTERFLGALGGHINIEHYAIGVSMPFEGWADLPSRYKQAAFAIERGAENSGVFRCQDYAFERLLSGLGEAERELELLHPALAVLTNYDEKNGTQLYETLRLYLVNERNMVKTAGELVLHRNSMKYRMQRIRELIGAELDNPRERMYILLSYYLA